MNGWAMNIDYFGMIRLQLARMGVRNCATSYPNKQRKYPQQNQTHLYFSYNNHHYKLEYWPSGKQWQGMLFLREYQYQHNGPMLDNRCKLFIHGTNDWKKVMGCLKDWNSNLE